MAQGQSILLTDDHVPVGPAARSGVRSGARRATV